MLPVTVNVQRLCERAVRIGAGTCRRRFGRNAPIDCSCCMLRGASISSSSSTASLSERGLKPGDRGDRGDRGEDVSDL